MTQATDRWRMVGFGFGLGGVVAGAAAAGGQPVAAVFAFLAIGALGTVLALSGAEWAVIQGDTADERQRSINDEAIRASYYAVLTVALIGFVVELVRGDPGPFTFVCFVGGFTNMIAVAVLRRRR